MKTRSLIRLLTLLAALSPLDLRAAVAQEIIIGDHGQPVATTRSMAQFYTAPASLGGLGRPTTGSVEGDVAGVHTWISQAPQTEQDNVETRVVRILAWLKAGVPKPVKPVSASVPRRSGRSAGGRGRHTRPAVRILKHKPAHPQAKPDIGNKEETTHV